MNAPAPPKIQLVEINQATGVSSSGAMLVKLYLAALAIRWLYDGVMYFAMGDNGLMGVDSFDYLHRAQVFAAELVSGRVTGWIWLGIDPMQMPLFSWMTSLCALISRTFTPLVYVLFQGLIDSGTCLLVYFIAREFDHRVALPAGIAAAINPTQIVMAGMLYPDTPFTFFAALVMLGAVRWLKTPSWSSIVMVALGLAAAASMRILIAPFGVALLTFFLLASLVTRRFGRIVLAHLCFAGVVYGAAVGAISLRNHFQYGTWELTPQSGMHLSRWIVPLVRQAKDGTPWRETYEELERRTHDRFGEVLADDPFGLSKQYTEIAMEELPRLGIAAIVKAWAYGAVLNIGTPAIVLSPPVLQLPRTGFYDTPGASMIEKMLNFMFRSDNRVYAWILLAGISGMVIVRIVQLAGLVALLRAGHGYLGLLTLAGWCAFILLTNGPVASPKYRLPMEPVLTVLTGAGFRARALLTRPSQG